MTKGVAGSNMERETREPQYQTHIDGVREKGPVYLGPTTSYLWREDPRHLGFLLARYKFVAKMLSGKRMVLEVGCGEAFGTRVVLQEVEQVCAVDFDPLFVEDANRRAEAAWRFDCRVHDILLAPVEGPFDAAYALDVLEHIPAADEDRFMTNIADSLVDDGVLIIGTPSIQSQAYASASSQAGHVNCKDHKELRSLMLSYFSNVFIFSMNDEIVHTGYYPMAQYLIALCVGKKHDPC